MDEDRVRVPRPLVVVVLSICLAPSALAGLGVDLGSASGGPTTTAIPTVAAFAVLSGAFTHSLLEWTAVCVAMITVLFAFVHYAIARDHAVPVIGVALFCSGAMDAFHTLAADRLIVTVADNRSLIPFTWAISRAFNALILVTGVGVLLAAPPGRSHGRLVLFASIAFGVGAYGIIQWCALSESLPQTMFAGGFVTRPYDVAPLVLFALAGVFLFPTLSTRSPSVFTHALVLSAAPQVVAQMQLVFGSDTLFDHHFHAAHALKVVAYFVPLLGLALDYERTHRRVTRIGHTLRRRTEELEHANAALEQFVESVSHDLRQPVRALDGFAAALEDEHGADLDPQASEYLQRIRAGAIRLGRMLDALLHYSRVAQGDMSSQVVDLSAVVRDVTDRLRAQTPEREVEVTVPDGLVAKGDPRLLRVLMRKLVSNAWRATCDSESACIEVGRELRGGHSVFFVRDNGVGFDSEHAERLFQAFQWVHARDTTDGSGIGLAVAQRIVNRHKGRIWAEGVPGQGATFFFTLEGEPSHE